MKKTFNAVAEAASRGYLKAGVAAGALLPALSFAATDPFDTVIGNATTKVTSYGGALAVFAGVAVIFMIGIKYLKKIPRAS